MKDNGRPKLPRTPIVVKRKGRLRWPQGEQIFYVLASNGLKICRDGEFFRSCAPARGWPPGLAKQEPFLIPRFPKLPQRLFERVVGYFDRIAALHGSEAAVLLVWNRAKKRVGLLVPEQTGTMLETWKGDDIALGLEYFPPTDLAEDTVVFGDIHSHLHWSAYASATDKEDESFRPGLHIVVGRIGEEPPELHIEAVADGTRFVLEESEVIGGYEKRRFDFPDSWLEKIKIVVRPKIAWPPTTTAPRYTGGRWSDRGQHP